MNTPAANIKKEVIEMLMFFIDGDLSIYGHIKKSTVELFDIQGIDFPVRFLSKIEK